MLSGKMVELQITNFGLAAIGAGVALAGGAIGTGMAQSGIGAAGMGMIAEDRKNMGLVLLFLAIPETLLIFGFLFAYLIMAKVGGLF